MHLGIVCNIFWKSFNVARSMGKLKAEFSELLLNCPYSTFHSWNFAIWGNSNMHFWEVSILNCPYPTFHCFVRNSWNFSIWGCIVGRYAELSLTNMIWEFIKRSSFIIGVDWGLNCFCYIWYIQNLPMPILKRKLM